MKCKGLKEMRNNFKTISMGDFKVIIDFDTCTGCGLCAANCAYDVYGEPKDGKTVVLAEDNCVGCMTCVTNCPVECIKVEEK